MKNISSYIPEYNGKKGKKVCRDVIGRVKIWKNTGKIWKNTHVRFLPRYLPVFYPCIIAMRSEYFTFLPFLPTKLYAQKIFFENIAPEEVSA